MLFDASLWRRWFLQLLSRMGLHTHYRAFYCVWERDYLTDVHCGRQDQWTALRDYLRSVGLEVPHIDEIIAARPDLKDYRDWLAIWPQAETIAVAVGQPHLIQ